MKKTIGICLFVVFGLLIAVIFFLFYDSGKKEVEEPSTTLAEEAEETEMEEFTEIMALQEPYLYLVKEQDGFLVVYQSDGITVEFETNIRIVDLEQEVLDRLEDGIGFSDEKSLYSFLESYSS